MENLKNIVLASQLEVEVQENLITDFSQYEEIANEWREKAKQIVVTNRNQITEMDMAKVAAKKFSEMRIKIEKRRKELKESALRKGQAIDAIAKYLQSLIAPIEDHLKKQADYIKLDDARILREAEEARLKAEEEAKLKREAEERAEQERIRKENERLRKEAEEREREMKRQQEEARRKQEAIEAKARKEAEEAKKKQFEIEELVKKEKEAKESLEKQIKKEQEEREKIAQEKKEQEQKAVKNLMYQNWLKEHNFDSNIMKVSHEGNIFSIWKKIAEIEL